MQQVEIHNFLRSKSCWGICGFHTLLYQFFLFFNVSKQVLKWNYSFLSVSVAKQVYHAGCIAISLVMGGKNAALPGVCSCPIYQQSLEKSCWPYLVICISYRVICISYKVIYISYKAKCVSVEYTIRCHPSPLMIFHFPVLYKNSSWSQNRIFLKRPESNPCLRRAYHWATTSEKYRFLYIFSFHICFNTKISVQ